MVDVGVVHYPRAEDCERPPRGYSTTPGHVDVRMPAESASGDSMTRQVTKETDSARGRVQRRGISVLAAVAMVLSFAACSLILAVVFAPSWHYLLVAGLASLSYAVIVIRKVVAGKE
jgi:hypothetical protein